MYFGLFVKCILILLSLNSITGSPNRHRRDEAQDENIVGEATNIIASTILKGNVDLNKNFVFSPFGISAILNILNEGAADETSSSISSVLRQPEQRERVRSSYEKILKNLQGDDPQTAPQFRTWFYIYRNNTVEEDFKKLIADKYYVTVKDIERNYYDWTEPQPPVTQSSNANDAPKSDEKDISELKSDSPVKDEKVVKVSETNENLKEKTADEEKPKQEPLKEEQLPPQTDSQTVKSEKIDESLLEKEKLEEKSVKLVQSQVKAVSKPDNSKDVTNFEEIKKTEPVVANDESRIDTQKDSSKFDEVVEDRQYVEVPVIKEHMEQVKTEGDANTSGVNLADGASTGLVSSIENSKQESGLADEKRKIDEKKVEQTTDEVKVAEIEPVKNSLPLKQFEEFEIMQADESRFGKAFGGSKVGDGTSIISGNSLVAEKENLKEGDTEPYESKMLLFNGLYYRGTWATPFQHLRDEEFENVFYTADEEKIPVRLMRSCGLFQYANLKQLDSEAVDFPYDNPRYSMLVIAPKSRDGLKKLTNDLDGNILRGITSELREEFIEVSLPKFHVETTQGSEKILAKAGLASIFTSKANFSGISKQQKLRIAELQQHVTFRADEEHSSENFLTASNALRSNAQPERSIVINQPFLFFVRDVIDNVIIVAGKITSLPLIDTHEPEIPK